MSDLLPFSADQFVAVFAAYNQATWPAPIVAYAIGLTIAVVPMLAHHRNLPMSAHAFVTLMLALMWVWTGVAYHGLFFSRINPAAIVFAALFVAQAAILAGASTTIRFAYARPADTIIGSLFVVYALIVYPVIGYLTCHAYPAAPVFGVTPCPVTIFTFGLLMQTAGRPPWLLITVPVIWSLIGGSAAFLLGVVQDWVLLLSGFLVLVRFAFRR